MGLFERRKKENAIQINEVNSNHYTPFLFPHKKGNKPIEKVYLHSLLRYIYNGMSNVTFASTKKNIVAEGICKFVDANVPVLLDMYWTLGYICVFYNSRGEIYIPNINDIRKDANGRVTNKSAIVYYSPTYVTNRISDFTVIAPMLARINDALNTEEYLNSTLGCFSIISGQDIPLNPEGKRQMLSSMKEMYGTASDKYQFMLANNDIKITTLNPNIDSLHLPEQALNSYKMLCNYFNVPTDLVLGESTFNNVSEAKKYFYDTCIRSYAEVLLKVARELLTVIGDFVPQNTITYRITNVPELESTLSAACSERTALLEYYTALQNAGQDMSMEISRLAEDSRNLLEEI